VIAAIGFGSLELKAQRPTEPKLEDQWTGHAVFPTPALAGQVRPHVWIRDAVTGPAEAMAAMRSGPGGFWPIDMQNAYGVGKISGLPSVATGLTGGGAGITVAIVDAYDAPNALADLNAFSTQFGLPKFPAAANSACSPTFTKVGETGSSTMLPPYNSGWEVEINLDTQWVHSIAPCANILLVEASSAGTGDLMPAITYASNHAQVVSMSWGSGEFRNESIYDTYFHTSDVVFLASAGDTGGVVEWPSVSNAVLAVGGTNLPASATGGLGNGAETGWSGSGGGCSAEAETEPTVETVIKYPVKCTTRGVPDVAASAGPSSAVAVYISKQGGWFQVYGTSLASPMWAAMVGIADGVRHTDRKAYLTNATLSDLYSAYSYSYASNFTDITSGTAGKNTAETGWDFVTGLGSPKAYALVPYLATAP
jgi:subtilase family serine protease